MQAFEREFCVWAETAHGPFSRLSTKFQKLFTDSQISEIINLSFQNMENRGQEF